MTREEAIMWIKTLQEDAIFEVNEALLLAIEALSKWIPKVSADRPHGEWEDKEVFNETDDDHIVDEWQSAMCSVCGKYHTTPYMYYFDNFNFCPNCGADMRKENK